MNVHKVNAAAEEGTVLHFEVELLGCGIEKQGVATQESG